MTRMLRAIDLVMRLIYVALVPFLLPIINVFMSITGLLIGSGLATVVALIGSDAWRARVERIPYAGRLLGGMGRLGDFYRRHPPKPLVFYILYPVLLPVLLFRRVPRHEFFLFRRMSVLTLIIITATGAYDYFRHWRPELSFEQFASATIAMMILQMIVTFMLIMPIVTTLVLLREGRRHRTLVALMVCMVATATYGAIDAHRTHAMAFTTWLRLEERTKYARLRAIQCEMLHPDEIERCVFRDPELHAMALALKAAREQKNYDDALAAARDKLRTFYKPDEADAFRLVDYNGVMVLFAHYDRKPAIWLAYWRKRFLIYPYQLPATLQRTLNLSGDTPTAARPR